MECSEKFGKKDILVLRDPTSTEQGIRTVAVVNDYLPGKDAYDVTFRRDEYGHPAMWKDSRVVPGGVERLVDEHETVDRSQLESTFRKVSTDSVDEALALYQGREVDPNQIVPIFRYSRRRK